MAWFGKKKDDFVDLGARYRRQNEQVSEMREEVQEEKEDATASGFSFLGGLANSGASSSSASEDYQDFSGSGDDKRRKLAKRLMDMTDKIEEMNNQIYHLQQRIEVLERKAGVGSY